MFWMLATGMVLIAALMPLYWQHHPEIKTTPTGLRNFKMISWLLALILLLCAFIFEN